MPIEQDRNAAHHAYHLALRHLEERHPLLAAQQFEAAIALGLDPMIGLYERWKTWMLLGEFERAWQETDRIESERRRGRRVEGHLIWNGAGFRNKVVLLRSDHGLGDAIQFLRYAPLLKDQCRHLIVKAKPILIPLLRTLPYIDKAIPSSAPDPEFEVEMELTELPYIFRTTLQTIPAGVPYIRIINHEPANSGNGSGNLNVGLVWASGPFNTRRSAGLAALRQLSAIPGLSFLSLQWGPDWVQAHTSNPGLAISNAFQPIPEDLIETALAVLQVDLVLTVDTMIAHLAGALAKPVWVLLHFDSDWRWMLDRFDSP